MNDSGPSKAVRKSVVAEDPKSLPGGDVGSRSGGGVFRGFNKPKRDSAGALRAATDGEFARAFPFLYEYLTCLVFEGSRRKTSSLSIFCEEDRFKACLNDKEVEMVLFRSSSTFQGLLEALEGALVNEEADWREAKWKGKRG